jgi:hypothetical protein
MAVEGRVLPAVAVRGSSFVCLSHEATPGHFESLGYYFRASACRLASDAGRRRSVVYPQSRRVPERPSQSMWTTAGLRAIKTLCPKRLCIVSRNGA